VLAVASDENLPMKERREAVIEIGQVVEEQEDKLTLSMDLKPRLRRYFGSEAVSFSRYGPLRPRSHCWPIRSLGVAPSTLHPAFSIVMWISVSVRCRRGSRPRGWHKPLDPLITCSAYGTVATRGSLVVRPLPGMHRHL
jgi:hypothetical protein